MNTSETDNTEMEVPETEAFETEDSEAKASVAETPVIEEPQPQSSATEVTETELPEPEAPVAETPEAETPELEALEAQLPPTEVTEITTPEPEELKQGPAIFKRILLYAAIVIGAIFMLIGLASIIGVWVVNPPVTDTILAVLQPIDNTLQRLETATGEADARLAEVATSLDDAQQRLQDLGAGLAETNLVAEALTRITGEEIGPKVEQAGQGIRAIYDTVVAVEETINAINAIPFVDIKIPGSNEMATIRTGMEEMAVSAAEVRQQAQQRREERAQNLVETLGAPIDRLSARVDEMQTRTGNTEERLGLAIERIDNLQNKIPLWIDLASIVLTLLYAWLVFSQWTVIRWAWQQLRV